MFFVASANGSGLALDVRGAGLRGDDRAQLACFDFVDVSGDGDPLREERRLDNAADLLAEIGLEIGEGEELEAAGVRAGPFGDLAADWLVFKGEHSAAGVLDDGELVRAK